MQIGIPVAYNVCEVKLDKRNHWICVYREDFQLRWYIKIQINSRISYRHKLNIWVLAVRRCITYSFS